MSTAPGQSPHLYLIRHGETEWALSGRHTGRTDIPLTPKGEEEARELGTHLRAITFSHVLTSPLQRAQRTCDMIGLVTVAEHEPDLMEWDYGHYDGLNSAEINKRHQGWNVFRDGCPHGETPAQVEGRADRLITRLRELRGNVALFSHGHFGGALAARWIGLPIVEARHFPLATASLSIFSFDPHRPAEPVIALWNASANRLFDTARCLPFRAPLTQAQGAMQRWDNEGGEIPRSTSMRRTEWEAKHA